MIGSLLGPYRVLEKLGEGGMGEVYKARDTRLDRIVALKVLPPEFSEDQDRRARFAREAKTISQLSHPHICALYDVGRLRAEGASAGQGGEIDFLVMELVEGETLAARLDRGAVPLEQALRIGAEIADALSFAHRHGIVHRDLKPANVILTKSGAKLLDFGLAKLKPGSGLWALGSGTGARQGATTESLTAQGKVLGTVPYMAPEQIEGQETDARTDIFALGCVLYELVTGRRAFAGDTSAALMSAILKDEPAPLAERQPLAPPALDRLVRKCLAKAPDDRWDSAHDVADEVRWIAEGVREQVRVVVGTMPRRRVWAVGAASLLAGVAVGAGLWTLFRPIQAGPGDVMRLEVSVRPAERLGGGGIGGVGVRTPGGSRTSFALSPDGRTLVFVGRTGDTHNLYARALDRDEATLIPGTLGAEQPFFSPEGKWVAFWSDQHLRKVPLAGGPAVEVCEVRSWPPTGASWGRDGTIVFGRTGGALWQVSAAGGEPVPLTELAPGERDHRLPQILPGGNAVLFTVRKRMRTWGDEELAVFSPADGTRTRILPGVDGRYVASGHLVFMQLGTLMAAPFDLAKIEVTGPPVAVLGDVSQAVNENHISLASGTGQFSVSDSGVLAWVRGGVVPREANTLAWVDRRGTITPLTMQPADYRAPRLSPDGRKVALTIWETTRVNIWVYDLARGTLSRLPSDNEDFWSIWSPDGRQLAFLSTVGGIDTVQRRAADGSGPIEPLASGVNSTPASWSPDGKELAFVTGNYAENVLQMDVWVARTDSEEPSARPVLQTRSGEWHPAFSPDNRWLAYSSNESGRTQVYLEPYPGPGSRETIDRGVSPAWAPNGHELFYLSPAATANKRRFMGVDVSTNPRLKVGLPHLLFEVDLNVLLMRGLPASYYDVAPDGQRFLTVLRGPVSDHPVTHVNVVLDWFEELKAKVPIK